MKPKYKNEIFKTLQNTSLGIESFLFEHLGSDNDGHDVDRITFMEDGQRSEMGFIVRQYFDSYDRFDCQCTLYAPEIKYSDYFPSDWIDITVICEYLKTWIGSDVKNYLEDKTEIDLWAEYLKASQFQDVKKIDFNDTGDFTYDEKQQILIALQSLNISINQNFKLNTDQLKLVNDGIKYLAEGVDRLNKVDWKTILIGQFFTLATAIATNPQQFTHLYHMFIKVVQVIYVISR